jgi:FixJ family two-component response regulator
MNNSATFESKPALRSATIPKQITETLVTADPPSRTAVTSADHVVLVVDDDYRVREALQSLLAASALCAIVFRSAAEYFAYPTPVVPACLILDVELPDINGLDLQEQLGQRYHPPIIFLTGHGDVPSSVRAIKAGALDFLTKPFNEPELLDLVHAALAQDRDYRAKEADLNCLRRRLETLTPREREVLPLVVSGLLNKQSAAHLGISEVTLQIHRAKVMQKMEADSLAELVRMAGWLNIPMDLSRHL